MPRWYGIGAAILIVSAVVLAFMIVGSPIEARRRAADDQRVERLHQLVRKVYAYYAKEKKLPSSLEMFEGGYDVPSGNLHKDPATGKPFGYRIVDTSRYELSATFETSHEYMGYGSYGEGWNVPSFAKHPAGTVTLRFDASVKPSAY